MWQCAVHVRGVVMMVEEAQSGRNAEDVAVNVLRMSWGVGGWRCRSGAILQRTNVDRGRIFASRDAAARLRSGNLRRSLPHDTAGTARVGTRTTATTGTIVGRKRSSGVLLGTNAGRWNGNFAASCSSCGNLLTGCQVGITVGTTETEVPPANFPPLNRVALIRKDRVVVGKVR